MQVGVFRVDPGYRESGTYVLCGTFLLLHKGVFGLGTTWDGLNLSPFFWVGLVPFDIWLEG